MGLFNTTDQVAVASVTYPLNGGGPQRDYLRTLFMGRLLLNPEASMAETIVQGTLNGPALRLRRFTKWAYNSDYASAVGVASGSIAGGIAIDEDTLKEELAKIAGTDIELATASIGNADITYWADQYMLENHPDEIDTGYTVDVSANGANILITMKDTDATVYTAPLVGYDSNKMYLYTSYRTKNLLGAYDNLKLLIYAEGGNNSVFNSYFGNSASFGAFMPIIPIRQDNRFISSSFMPNVYPLVKTAMRKAFPSGNFDKLVKDLTVNNESIDDVDFANIVFGVPLNTPTQQGKQYIYRLLDRAVQVIPQDPLRPGSGGFGFGGPLGRSTIQWNRVFRRTEPGLIFSGAKIGDADIRNNWPFAGEVAFVSQTSATSYSAIYFMRLSHSNWVYKDKVVGTDANINLMSETDISPFLFPLDINLLNDLGIIRANQFGDYVGHIVFNTYEVKKHKWYEEGVLNMAVMVVVVAVAAMTAGTGAGASGGLLGTPAAIGGALGFSGALALYIGTIANAVAALLLMKIIQKGATALFGEDIGMIVGTIAGMVAIAYGTSYSTGQPMSQVMNQVIQPQALTRLTSSVGQGYTEFLQDSLADEQRSLDALYAEASRINREIKNLTEENLSNGLMYINPLSFVDVLGQAGESRESFLKRTLMTGTDIAELGLRMLEDYANISLDTSLPTQGTI